MDGWIITGLAEEPRDGQEKKKKKSRLPRAKRKNSTDERPYDAGSPGTPKQKETRLFSETFARGWNEGSMTRKVKDISRKMKNLFVGKFKQCTVNRQPFIQ
jgi:hypothetical protein